MAVPLHSENASLSNYRIKIALFSVGFYEASQHRQKIKFILLTFFWFTVLRSIKFVSNSAHTGSCFWLMLRQWCAGMWWPVDKIPEQEDGKSDRASQQDASVERRNSVPRSQLQRQSHPGLHQKLPNCAQQRLWVCSSSLVCVC